MHVTLCPEHAYYAPSPQMYKAACLVNIESYATWTLCRHTPTLLEFSIYYGIRIMASWWTSLSKLQRISFFLSWKDVKPACLCLNHFRDDFFFPSSFIEITAAHNIKSLYFCSHRIYVCCMYDVRAQYATFASKFHVGCFFECNSSVSLGVETKTVSFEIC